MAEQFLTQHDQSRLLLVIPRYASAVQYGYILPLGILYVSAAIKESGVCPVFTVNLNHQTDDDATVIRNLFAEHRITHVGTTGISGQFSDVYPLLRLVKSLNPSVRTIVGGGIITGDPLPAMQAFNGLADYGVVGEGEVTIVRLMQALSSGADLCQVEGLVYADNGHWVLTPRCPDISDLDALPLPDYEGFDYARYLATNGEVCNGVRYSPVAIVGGRSCKYNCTFCFHPTGSHYRQRSLDSIFAEIDYLVSHYAVNYIALREELFASDARRVIDFCSRIRSYPLTWSIQLRVDCVTASVVSALAASGCRYVFLGIESADDEILRSMRKHITIKQVEEALELTARAGLATRSSLILGDAIESEESARRTLQWWHAYRHRFAIDLGLIIAFPGSALYQQARRNGRIPDPVQFLRDGCPVINLSTRMSDEAYSRLAVEVSRCSGISFHPHSYV